MKILAEYDPQDKEQWLQLREQGLGGSDAAAIMGADPWRGPYDVWHDRIYPKRGDDSGEAAYWGNTLERIIADEFAKRKSAATGEAIQVSEHFVVYQHETVPCMLATVDRVVHNMTPGRPWTQATLLGLLEVKTRSAFVTKQWDAGVPEKVWWQVQHYLAVTGLRDAWVAVLLGGQKYQDYYVPRDDRSIAQLEAACSALWLRVVDKNPPPINASVETVERLESIVPTRGAEVELPFPIVDDAVYKYRQLKARIAVAEAELDECAIQIKAALGEAETGIYEGRRVVTWKAAERRSVDLKRLRAERPEVAKQYETTTSYRTLRVRGEDDE